MSSGFSDFDIIMTALPIAAFPNVIAKPTINKNVANIVSDDDMISVRMLIMLNINPIAKRPQPKAIPFRQLRISNL